ncbi:DUF4177 domain-containing protein [Tsukamurella pseudospumae]|uniref:DUF4177 domain-containing protein n=1 Tax=Tsukamurella pseudospumae TaxID=239498 RepID=UPI000A978346|nr:DUF4177 domain-containing protein [Tsukamurella pseudospumae]
MTQYKTVTVEDGLLSSLDYMVDKKAAEEGKQGWRLVSVNKVSEKKARCEFAKD